MVDWVMSDHCFAMELSDNVEFGYQQSLNIQLQDQNGSDEIRMPVALSVSQQAGNVRGDEYTTNISLVHEQSQIMPKKHCTIAIIYCKV